MRAALCSLLKCRIARVNFDRFGNSFSVQKFPLMTADELQRWASILRWVGLSVTGLGLLITFGSHYIADTLFSVQRSEKTKAQERSQASEAELQAIKNRVSWRQLPNSFGEALAGRATGSAEIVYRGGDDEAYSFATSIWEALQSAGWTVPTPVTQKDGVGSSDSSGLPFMMREAGMSVSNWSTVAVLTRGPLAAKPYDGTTPLDVLMHAFDAAGLSVLHLIPRESIRPQPGVLRIVIGSRL